jgi:REP element-mobilizing transposase RayT
MSRKLRIEYPGAMYHVMNRGDQREDIFRDDEDRQKFLSTLGEACAKTERGRFVRMSYSLREGASDVGW